MIPDENPLVVTDILSNLKITDPPSTAHMRRAYPPPVKDLPRIPPPPRRHQTVVKDRASRRAQLNERFEKSLEALSLEEVESGYMVTDGEGNDLYLTLAKHEWILQWIEGVKLAEPHSGDAGKCRKNPSGINPTSATEKKRLARGFILVPATFSIARSNPDETPNASPYPSPHEAPTSTASASSTTSADSLRPTFEDYPGNTQAPREIQDVNTAALASGGFFQFSKEGLIALHKEAVRSGEMVRNVMGGIRFRHRQGIKVSCIGWRLLKQLVEMG
ncbi:MAG: hypothetical protein MMC33_005435 [Icmadophila ericetorum]|nr:hypothetical protein [Icmadophila ericetorum]